MEQIRELLFGRDMQKIREQLQSLESSINQLRDELKRSHGGLETALYNETTARNRVIEELDNSLKTAVSSFENQLSGLETRIDEDLQALSSRTEQRFNDTESQINNRHEELSRSLATSTENLHQELANSTQRLHQEKASKRTIAGLLESMAQAVREETE